jgi:primary-amine oxidase
VKSLLTFSIAVEIHQINLRPADFFSANPSLDVPSNKNLESKLVVNGNGVNGHASNGDACCK